MLFGKSVAAGSSGFDGGGILSSSECACFVRTGSPLPDAAGDDVQFGIVAEIGLLQQDGVFQSMARNPLGPRRCCNVSWLSF